LVISPYLPSLCPAPREARRCLPSRGSCGPQVPTFPGTLRRSDCPTAPLRALRLALASRYLARFGSFGLSHTGACAGRRPQSTPGLLVTRSPIPGMGQGDTWRSHVPELPRCMHAPLFAPGGVLHARQSASRPAAFRPLATVGLPRRTPLRALLLSTPLLIARLQHAACLLAPSSFVPPLLGVHVAFTPDRLAKLWSGGT
jgi:hypothetical protein